jgi:dihydroorotase
MSADTLLVNGKIPIGRELVEGCVAFRSGKICYVGKEVSSPTARERIDVDGNVILPGLIDAHVHLRDLGQASKEDFLTGTRSALSGGFTTVLDMPYSIPPTDSPENLEQKMEAARSRVVVNVGLYGAFEPSLKYVRDLARLGVVGFKVFTTRRQPMDGDDDSVIEKALLCARQAGVPVAFHAEDLKTIEGLELTYKASGNCSPMVFADAHPPEAESIAVARIVAICEKTKASIHFCHLSTKESLRIVIAAKARGLPVTCEVTPHHLLLSEREVSSQGGIAVVDPPLRGCCHQHALFDGLRQDVDLIASDHAPHTLREKVSEDPWSISPGFPGLETTLPVMLTAVNHGMLTMTRLIELLAANPARIFGLSSKGSLSVGHDADVTVVDLERRHVVDPSKFESKAKYSPFKGFDAIGEAVKVFVAGRRVMDNGDIMAEPGSGSIVLRL